MENKIEKDEVKKLFYTIPELHKALGEIVSKAYLYTMIKRGEIVTRRIGGKIVVPATWVDKYIEDMTALPEKPTTGNQKGA